MMHSPDRGEPADQHGSAGCHCCGSEEEGCHAAEERTWRRRVAGFMP
jgi:hypothetical protein